MSPILTLCPNCKQPRPCTCGHDTQRRTRNNIDRRRNTAHWIRTSTRRRRITGGYCEGGHPGCTIHATGVHLIGGGDHSRARLEDTRALCDHCHRIEERLERDGREPRAVF